MLCTTVNTTYTVMKCYRQFYAEIIREHAATIGHLQDQFKETKTVVHKVWHVVHRNRKFVIVCYYSKKQEYTYIFQLLEGTQYTEAFMYNPSKNKCTWYHDHFFLRYAQRFSLQHKPHEEVIVHYFLHNPLMAKARGTKARKDLRFTVSVVKHGVVYGYYDVKNRIMNYRTIIDFFRLSEIKKKKVRRLRYELCLLEQAV